MSNLFLNRKVALCLLMSLTLMSPGCLSLLSMRELMEDMKEDPKSQSQDTRVGWDYTFDTQDIESTEYY